MCQKPPPDNSHERRYIRHPSRVPIQVDPRDDTPSGEEHLRNVGEGGLCFASTLALDPGQPIRLTIPLFDRQHRIDAHVAWCRPSETGYDVGVFFVSRQDRFCARMVEQMCYIEDYRQRVAREEGRQLSSEQAAHEWIERFADQFPGNQ